MPLALSQSNRANFVKFWIQKIKWDVDLLLHFSEPYKAWLNQLPLLSHIEITRWLNTDYENEDIVTFYIFSGIGERAYVTCAFLRGETAEGMSSVTKREFIKILQLSFCGTNFALKLNI